MFDLKVAREEKRMTQQDLATLVGVTRQAIGNYENGSNKPSVDVAKAIGKALDIDWTLLFEE